MGGPWDFGLALVWFRRSSSLYNIFFLFWEEKHKRTRQEETDSKSQLKFQLEIPENCVEVFTFFKESLRDIKSQSKTCTDSSRSQFIMRYQFSSWLFFILYLTLLLIKTFWKQLLLNVKWCLQNIQLNRVILCPQSSQEANCNSNYH